MAEEGGFNRASHRLRITQPAVSYQVKQLEMELGQSLFNRGPRGVTTTEAGRVLLQHALQVFESIRRTRHALQRLSGGVAGEVRIGTVNSVGMYVLPDVLRQIRVKYPSIRPTILFRNSHAVMDALHSNQIEMAIVANPSPDRRYRFEALIEEPVSLVCGRAHPFFGRLEVDPEELRQVDFVSLTDDTPTGRLARAQLEQLGVTRAPVVLTENIETIKRMVEVGLGVALLPNMVTSEEVACDLRLSGQLARIAIPMKLERRIVLVTWKQFELSPAASAFIELLRAECKDWADCLDDGSRTKTPS